ncbi:hypothetical protein [Klebsiella pneumoniae]|uniref:hypothetical protein n=1 Tax=Klebsiella pneumoniae TaxID=573 RepID=UPI00065255E1|nr:hypothetical protein [Klebsiella pneumoniae]KMI90456.1 hypothetical protein SN00_02287 [Klebsiella pneumoniae]HBS9599907.1 hypothetical protein [Klebsiella pneumoniae]
MTDITELAQSLKAAADREMICRDGAETSEIWERTVTPENILALVEALEKAQQRNGELETYSKTAIEFREAARDKNRHLKLELEIAEKRIAELEARTVTVKLPQRLQPGADGWDDWYVHSDDEGEYLKFDDVLAMLTAAGIKWEAE